MKVAIVAGGTGGHIYPGIAIADEIMLRDPQVEILFLGSHEGMERELINQAGYDLQLIKSRAFQRQLSYKAFSAPFISIIGVFQAFRILMQFRPKALISTGGYASLPVVISAKMLSIPIFIHEQNVLPGVVNRFCSKFAKKVFLTFHASKKYISGEVVGNPVRTRIINADKISARRALNLPLDGWVVLIMGGSQGSKSINQAVVESIDKIPKHIQVIHVVGNRDFAWVQQLIEGKVTKNYHAMPYLHNNIADALASADMVFSRAGATATAEFLVRHLPMVLIPYPYAADNHQLKNAKVFEENEAAIIVKDKDFTADKFIELISQPHINYAKMSEASKKMAEPEAAKRIVDYVVN